MIMYKQNIFLGHYLLNSQAEIHSKAACMGSWQKFCNLSTYYKNIFGRESFAVSPWAYTPCASVLCRVRYMHMKLYQIASCFFCCGSCSVESAFTGSFFAA